MLVIHDVFTDRLRKLGSIGGSNGARTIAKSLFDKPGERHKINSCVNEINSRLCSLSKVNPLALW